MGALRCGGGIPGLQTGGVVDDPEQMLGAPCPLRWSCQTARAQSWAGVLGVAAGGGGHWEFVGLARGLAGSWGLQPSRAHVPLLAEPPQAVWVRSPCSSPRLQDPVHPQRPVVHPAGVGSSAPRRSGIPRPRSPALHRFSFPPGATPSPQPLKSPQPSWCLHRPPGARVRQPRSALPTPPRPVLSDRKCDSKPSNFFFFFFFFLGLACLVHARLALPFFAFPHMTCRCVWEPSAAGALISGIECDPPPGFSPPGQAGGFDSGTK